ncbi:MAG: glycogen-binding domain-containing protein [Candidatus Omnitrophota bacterium]
MARILKAKSVEFKFHAPQARKVSVAGTFNGWSTDKLPAKRDLKGNWIAKASLKPGKYEYKMFVDGNWVNDPNCHSCVTNTFGTHNCTIDIK